MDDQFELLQQIEEYCRVAGIAETTFGKRSVNDGKFVHFLGDVGQLVANPNSRHLRRHRGKRPPHRIRRIRLEIESVDRAEPALPEGAEISVFIDDRAAAIPISDGIFGVHVSQVGQGSFSPSLSVLIVWLSTSSLVGLPPGARETVSA